MGDAVTTRPRPTTGRRRTHGSPKAILGWEMHSRLARGQPRRETQSRLARGQPVQPSHFGSLEATPRRRGDAVTTWLRLTPGRRSSHDSFVANPWRETQSRLARGQPRAGDLVMTRPRPTSGVRRIHDSPEANPRWETHSRPARGQPQVGDTITARSRPKLDKKSISDSPEGILGNAPEGAQLRRPTPPTNS
jgi:hypothetical protein